MELKKDFNHSFERLEAILCWHSRIKDGEEVVDLAGRKGTYKITSAPDGVKNRFIMVLGSSRNVEVLVLKEILEAAGVKFRPPGDE